MCSIVGTAFYMTNIPRMIKTQTDFGLINNLTITTQATSFHFQSLNNLQGITLKQNTLKAQRSNKFLSFSMQIRFQQSLDPKYLACHHHKELYLLILQPLHECFKNMDKSDRNEGALVKFFCTSSPNIPSRRTNGTLWVRNNTYFKQFQLSRENVITSLPKKHPNHSWSLDIPYLIP